MINSIFCKLLGLLKYILFIGSFILFIFGIFIAYEKSISFMSLLPMGLVFLCLIVNLFIKNKNISNNMFLNFVSFVVFGAILIVCLRAKFDSSMLIYQKYKINFNPIYFKNNIPLINLMCYLIVISNVILYISLFFREKKIVISNTNEIL